MNQPGTYLHWNVFTVSVANLALIAVMVAIFGAALLLPFPGRRHGVAVPDAATGPAEVARERIRAALDELDETIHEIRDHAFGDGPRP
jgi:hypothetical protein